LAAVDNWGMGAGHYDRKVPVQLSLSHKYSRVASSRLGYYSILDPFGHRSQYINIKFSLQNSLKILLATLWYFVNKTVSLTMIK
jgi:hypothetical protein